MPRRRARQKKEILPSQQLDAPKTDQEEINPFNSNLRSNKNLSDELLKQARKSIDPLKQTRMHLDPI